MAVDHKHIYLALWGIRIEVMAFDGALSLVKSLNYGIKVQKCNFIGILHQFFNNLKNITERNNNSK